MGFGVSAALCIPWRFAPGGGPTILSVCGVLFFCNCGEGCCMGCFRRARGVRGIHTNTVRTVTCTCFMIFLRLWFFPFGINVYYVPPRIVFTVYLFLLHIFLFSLFWFLLLFYASHVFLFLDTIWWRWWSSSWALTRQAIFLWACSTLRHLRGYWELLNCFSSSDVVMILKTGMWFGVRDFPGVQISWGPMRLNPFFWSNSNTQIVTNEKRDMPKNYY